MDSDKSDEDEHEAISKQIVEYYKKYSLSQQLPKYFSGTPLSYMPKIVKDDEINKPVIIVEDVSTATLVPKQSEYVQTDVDEAAEPKAVSPASSVASIRKLEWDSGADIGYNNCNKSATKLHKSSSLPTLTTSVHKIKETSPKTNLTSHIVNVISYSSTSDHEKPAQLSSSSSSYQAEARVISSSSSSGAKPPNPVSSSSSSSFRPPSAKPSTSSSSSFANTLAYLKSKIGSPDAESTPKVDTHYKPSETPFIPRPYKKIPNKVIELCVTKPISIECMDGKKKKALDKRIQTSFVEKLSKSVQTGDDTIEDSKKKGPRENQSVIVISYDVSEKKTCSSNTQTDSEVIPSPRDRQDVRTASTDSSKEIPPLGQLISRRHSKSLVADIDRSIELLQKLLKSKKYDAATKKRYIKKIVQKIVDNKYNEDSTTSSELFMPKKQQEDKIQPKLQENVPWYPAKMSKFGVKTFKEEFVPDETKKKSMFTVSEARYTPTTSVESYSSLEKQQNTTSASFQSWKEDKTLSERLLEEKQKGEGDQLINFAMKERQNQIDWINDEISHLVKLKGLLEHNQGQTSTAVYMVSPQYDSSGSNKLSRSQSISRAQIPTLSNASSKESLNGQIQNKKQSISVSGDVDIISEKVKPKDVESCPKTCPRKPSLIGTGKYDTYPRSKQEEQRCWPCGIMERRKERLKPERYSFDVPLSEDATAIIKKVDEIVSKYGSSKSSTKSSNTSPENNTCPCKKKSQAKIDCVCKLAKEDAGTTTTNKCTCKSVATSTTTCLCQCKSVQKVDCPAFVKKCKSRKCSVCNNCKPSLESSTSGSCDCKCGKRSTVPPSSCDKDIQCSICCKCQSPDALPSDTDDNIPLKGRSSLSESEDKSIETDNKTSEDKSTKYDAIEREDVGVQCICPDDVNKSVQCKCVEYNVQPKSDCKCGSKERLTQRFDEESPKSRSTSSSRSVSSGSSTSGTVHSCMCCKKKNVTSKYLYELRRKLSAEAYPLCKPCYRQNQKCCYSYNTYTDPSHVCNCYTVVQTSTLNAIKKTIGDLEEMDCCSCADVEHASNSSCCKYCKKKLKRTSKKRNAIAYLLTFENGTPYKEETKRAPLEEIKIKIPTTRKKKYKDKENKKRKDSKVEECTLQVLGVLD